MSAALEVAPHADERIPVPVSKWRAVIVAKAYQWSDPFVAKLSPVVRDDDKSEGATPSVSFVPGEKGFLIQEQTINGVVMAKTQFFRYGRAFVAILPKANLRVGNRYRSLSEKLEAMEALRPPVSLSTEMQQWRDIGSPFTRYVKHLWLALRRNRSQLEQLGLWLDLSQKMFDEGHFVANVDNLCAAFLPAFKKVMDMPNATPQKLIQFCDRQREDWPSPDQHVVYLRVYTHQDPQRSDVNAAAIYCGQTNDAHGRELSHLEHTRKHTPRSGRLGHYDIAAATPAERCHVLIVVCNDTMSVAGNVRIAKNMLEQTIILTLQAYASFVGTTPRQRSFGNPQRINFLSALERQVRLDTNFQPKWRITHGTNTNSPLFEFAWLWKGTVAVEDGRSPFGHIMVQSVEPRHPSLPGRKVYRTVREVYIWSRNDYGIVFYGMSGTSAADTVRAGRETDDKFKFAVPLVLAEKIIASTKATPGRSFKVVLVFELLDKGVPHERPYLGFPSLGPYVNYNGVNSLGIRLEWQDATSKLWYTCPIAVRRHVLTKIGQGMYQGDAGASIDHFSRVTALIHMLRSQQCVDPTGVFYRTAYFRSNVPTVQHFIVDHLSQSARWEIPVSREVPAPQKATFEHNYAIMVKNAHLLSKYTVVNAPEGGKKDAIYDVDNISLQSSVRANDVVCDTCTLLGRIRTEPNLTSSTFFHGFKDCKYDHTDKTCDVCKAMVRPCTFTPLKPLAFAWIGPGATEMLKNSAGQLILPLVGKGPMRHLLHHVLCGGDELVTPVEIDEPFQVRTLLDFADFEEADLTGTGTETDENLSAMRTVMKADKDDNM